MICSKLWIWDPLPRTAFSNCVFLLELFFLRGHIFSGLSARSHKGDHPLKQNCRMWNLLYIHHKRNERLKKSWRILPVKFPVSTAWLGHSHYNMPEASIGDNDYIYIDYNIIVGRGLFYTSQDDRFYTFYRLDSLCQTCHHYVYV